MSHTKSIHRNESRARVALLSIIAAMTLALGAQNALAQAAAAGQPVASGPAAASGLPVQTSYASIVSRVAPAVVTVRSERRVAASSRQLPFLDDDTLRELFGNQAPQTPRGRQGQPQQPRTERQEGLGSGVIVSPDGYILTNNHVVEGSQEVSVETTDNRVFKAKVVGTDAPSDLAVLKIEATSLPVLTLGDSDRTQVGDVVLAVGNPLGIGQTVTSGIISAKGRSTGLGDGSFEDFIQTDAAINRGNSGGALVNTSGELIGINSQILSPSGGSIGIGFAIPANMARDVMGQLIKQGQVHRGMIGVGIQSVTADLAQSLGLTQVRGALVNEVRPASPAASAGVKRGDVIVAFNGAPVVDSNAFRNMVARMQPGTPVTFTVARDGRELELRATLAELPVNDSKDEGEAAAGAGASNAEAGKLGVAVEPLTPETAARMELPRDTRGLVVTSVDPEGPGTDAGLRRGDVLSEVNRKPVSTREELRSALAGSGTRPVLLLVTREGQTIFLTVRMRQ
ncbi:MAG TPA: DegQ family serine endoprotease [Pyrinomonadaceae bacterium]|nr:DegQ family serine endoprotease [Pyrinomonadaceae bacterium]